ncbi:hypothetical protein YSY22_10230 [Brevibacillus formosus]
MFETLIEFVELINAFKELITQSSFVMIVLAYLAIKYKSQISEYLN